MQRGFLTNGVCFLCWSVLMLALGAGIKGAIHGAAAQGGGGAVPIGNGDVNADGEIDISDGIYILSWLFTGGTPPVAIECPPTGLPVTGLATCYDSAGNVIDCGSGEYPGQDGAYQAGCPEDGRFVDNRDGTVTDTCTGLMWQKLTAPGSYSWQAALKYCESLDFAGHDDWRLPNVRELQSIVDNGRFNPAIDSVFEAKSGWYWSSTSYPQITDIAWGVSFHDGVVDYQYGSYNSKDKDSFVRAVRGGL